MLHTLPHERQDFCAKRCFKISFWFHLNEIFCNFPSFSGNKESNPPRIVGYCAEGFTTSSRQVSDSNIHYEIT